MAQWLTRGTAVVGVLVLEWVSSGYGPPPASPPLPAPQVQARPVIPNGGEPSRAVETLAQLPLRFEANAGQFDDGIRFAARGVGYGVALTPAGATLNLTSSTGTTAGVAMTIVGRDGAPAAARHVAGRELLPGVVNHVIGSDRTRWHMGVELFARVRHADVYDGIDLEFYGNQQRLEHDFLVAPGADPATIRVRFDGAERVEVDGRGDLLVHVPGGEPLRQQAPISYQVIDGVRRDVASHYVRLGANEIGFMVGAYDRREPLTIDPVLIYSSFFGGTAAEQAFDIALDPSGNIYLTGKTLGGGTLPVTPGAPAGVASRAERRVRREVQCRWDRVDLLHVPGRHGHDMTRSFRPGRIAADAIGNAYVAGDTSSADFPSGGAGADTSYGGGNANPSDAFYVKLGPTGAFLYGTYMGGADYDWSTGIAVDAPATSTSAAGRPRTAARSRRPPTPSTPPRQLRRVPRKFDAAGTRVYSTFFGGTGGEHWQLRRRPGHRRSGPRLHDRRHLQHRSADRERLPDHVRRRQRARRACGGHRHDARPAPRCSTRRISAATAPTWAWASPTRQPHRLRRRRGRSRLPGRQRARSDAQRRQQRRFRPRSTRRRPARRR